MIGTFSYQTALDYGKVGCCGALLALDGGLVPCRVVRTQVELFG